MTLDLSEGGAQGYTQRTGVHVHVRSCDVPGNIPGISQSCFEPQRVHSTLGHNGSVSLARCWNKRLDEVLSKNGLRAATADP